jgi:hypothetical protein
VAAGIAILQPSGEDCIQGRSRNDSELTQLGHGPRKPPTGDARAHAALNDHRITTHIEGTDNALFQGWTILIV